MRLKSCITKATRQNWQPKQVVNFKPQNILCTSRFYIWRVHPGPLGKVLLERYFCNYIDRLGDPGATLRLGGGRGGGGHVSDSIYIGGGGTRHFFILTFYNSKTIGGGGEALAHPASPVPQSLRLEGRLLLCICVWFSVQVRALDKMKIHHNFNAMHGIR